MLLAAEPDVAAAERWSLANELRRRKDIGGSEKILDFFKANVGTVVTTEELKYVANDAAEFGRRTRALRTESGYAIATRYTGRPDLSVGEYVMESSDRVAEPHDRNIKKEIQRKVYERDSNTCQSCGWNRDLWTSDDPRILELHHRRSHKNHGPNTAENLCVLCNVCHDGVHANRIDGFID